ncbi:MAG: hypothetical protein RR209_00015 [Angelakisella sp.]
MEDVINILLRMDIQKPETREIKIKRLSTLAAEDVSFTIRELTYSAVADIKQIEVDTSVHIVLAGVVTPDLKSKELMVHYGAATPAELVKKILRPGEIEDISREIEKLCGYRVNTIEAMEDIKKK